MKYKELLQKRADLVAKGRGILDKAATEKRSITDEERDAHKAIMADVESVTADIELEEQQQRLEAAVAVVDTSNTMTDAERAVLTSATVRERVEDDPKRGFKTPREYMLSVMNSERQNTLDPRLKPLIIRAAAGSDEQTGINDPFGGYAVPVAFSPSLLEITPEGDFIAGRTTMVPMTTPRVEFPARVDKDHTSSVSGGLTVTRRPETVALTSSRTQLEKVALQATSQFGLAFATEEILTDSAISFIAMLERGFDQEFASAHIQEMLNGTGNGEPEGVNTCPALITQAKEGGQGADTIVFDNITKMRARVWGYGAAIWVANHNIYPQLAKLSLAVGTGGSAVWQPSLIPDRPDMILGRPVFFTEYANTLGDAGDLLCLNLSQYLEGLLQGMQGAESMHVRFVNHERTFKFWHRNDGRSWWRAVLTPKNGSTLSPFVRLAARA